MRLLVVSVFLLGCKTKNTRPGIAETHLGSAAVCIPDAHDEDKVYCIRHGAEIGCLVRGERASCWVIKVGATEAQ